MFSLYSKVNLVQNSKYIKYFKCYIWKIKYNYFNKQYIITIPKYQADRNTHLQIKLQENEVQSEWVINTF